MTPKPRHELKQDELYDLSKKVGDVSESDALQHLADLQHDLRQLDQEVSEADQLLGQIKAHHQQRQELEPQLSAAKRAKWSYQQIEEALYPGTATRSPGPLRAQITEKLMESIGQEASRILASLGWYMSVAYSKKGGFSVHDRTHGVTRKYDTYSGGERFAIAIAIALAVGRVTHGAGNIRCLFIDEGFGALDTKNRGRIITEAIGKLIENEWRDQVVIISHLEDMKGYFPRKIELVRQNDCSMLATELEE
jgi:DNA repair exonuclease SbcCD ATPase subunit